MKFNHAKLRDARKTAGYQSAVDLSFALRKRNMRISPNTILRWERGLESPPVCDLCEILSVVKERPENFFN